MLNTAATPRRFEALDGLGVLSCSIYVVHTFLQSRMGDALRLPAKATGINLIVPEKAGLSRGMHDFVGATPLQGAVLTLVMLALVIGVASLIWHRIEVPAQTPSRRLATWQADTRIACAVER
jgi:peptidoglycan/LPS O-acetylase OafA/YrhL